MRIMFKDAVLVMLFAVVFQPHVRASEANKSEQSEKEAVVCSDAYTSVTIPLANLDENIPVCELVNDGYDILDGWLLIGLPESVVIAKLGDPERGERTYYPLNSTYVERWDYSEAGLRLDMEYPKDGGQGKVTNIFVEAPSTMKTTRGIGIGNTGKLVRKKYARMDTRYAPRQLIVGSYVGGTIFYVDDEGFVEKIIIGAAIE